jgi:succinate dehydrogenase/fumarate reductase cytochrome b subunit
MDSTDVTAASRRAGDHPALETAARVGYAVNGVLHIVIGIIALQLAFGSKGKSADQSGALGSMADNGFGLVMLWVAVVAWLGLALWRVTEAISGGWETSDRLKAATKAVVYLVLSWTAFKFASGTGSSSKSQTTDFTASLMKQPAGQWLVALVGLAVIGVGVYHVVKGWRKKFLQDLETHPSEWIVKAGRVGYIAKGIALAIVGGLFVLAAVRHKPSEARGLDGALRNLLGAPGGPFLLGLVALGLIAFGVYCFGRARHADV